MPESKKKNLSKKTPTTEENNLLIVESPTKEKTISKYLSDNFTVASSYGHIRDLPEKELGIDIENNFAPIYKWLPKARKTVARLKKLVSSADNIYLATDLDREGEAIAWHIADGLQIDKNKIKRITFHEITKEAILEALKNPRQIDPHLVDAQSARRVLDRLVGYKLSPVLWKKIRGGLSAGRVQSAALRLIVEREQEIKNFKSEKYWSIKVLLAPLSSDNENIFDAHLIKIDGQKIEKETAYKLFAGPYKVKSTILSDEKILQSHITELKKSNFIVEKITKSSQSRKPYPPYTTSTLQQDASRRLGFYAKKTMNVAQSLYEGVEVGGGEPVGLITYMRTDSTNVASVAISAAREYILKNYGGRYMPEHPTIYKTKTKGAQEAHEAIRPTSVARTPEEIKKYLTKEQYLLYDLIWRRFVASQMSPAEFSVISVDISTVGGKYLLRASGREMIFDGYLKVYKTEEEEESSKKLPLLNGGDKLSLKDVVPEEHNTTPPPRYNEASLIKTLEEYGIGRPSTYAAIISTILQRKYVELKERRFIPTEIGFSVSDFLKKYFKEIVDLKFTAGAEERLDEIAEGKVVWQDVIKDFWEKFSKDITEASKLTVSNEKCPDCGAPLVERASRYGKFLACSAFPKCRYIKKEERRRSSPDKAPVMTDEKCPDCGAPLVERASRYGRFLACSAFPKCRYIKGNRKKNSKDDTVQKEVSENKNHAE